MSMSLEIERDLLGGGSEQDPSPKIGLHFVPTTRSVISHGLFTNSPYEQNHLKILMSCNSILIIRAQEFFRKRVYRTKFSINRVYVLKCLSEIIKKKKN